MRANFAEDLLPRGNHCLQGRFSASIERVLVYIRSV